MTDMTAVALRDVTLRDGLQDERPVDTDGKVELFDRLLAAGVTDLELTSFVRPDRVPAMADGEELARRTAGRDGITRWGLVLNDRGAARALDCGLSHLQYVISVSEQHQMRNAGGDVATSLLDLRRVVERAARGGATVEVTLATAFGCPYAGPIARSEVVALA
ncbi:MAG TPA: hypothetical protein VGP46_11330, partial [Acidimicrobiales bacterium]|nr:hypothetical protein [Acidimicrobiales bacterium]